MDKKDFFEEKNFPLNFLSYIYFYFFWNFNIKKYSKQHVWTLSHSLIGLKLLENEAKIPIWNHFILYAVAIFYGKQQKIFLHASENSNFVCMKPLIFQKHISTEKCVELSWL